MIVEFGWQRWAAASLLSGIVVDDVVTTMVREKIDAEPAGQTCHGLVESPAYAAGSCVYAAAEQAREDLAVLARLDSLNGHAIPKPKFAGTSA